MLTAKITNRYLPFWIFSLSIGFGLILPRLIQEGMWQDGMLYSGVAHNLSVGYGTFWFPQYSTLNVFGLHSFHEHPPLVFGIEALFFKVLGDSIYVERFYTFFTLIISIILINQIWKIIFFKDANVAALGWLPVLLWLIIPICYWNFQNNMQENTMDVFLFGSVLLSLHAIQSPKHKILLWILSGFSIVLATLCKGIPGFFPITLPFLYWLSTRKISFKESIFYSIILILVPVASYCILILIPESRESLSLYFFQRVLNRIQYLPSTTNRLNILWSLFTQLLPPLIFVIIVQILFRIRESPPPSKFSKLSLVFILLGVAGSAPLALTFCQRDYYLVPSLSYFAIGLAILIAPEVADFIHSINVGNVKFKLFRFFSIIFFLSVFIFTQTQIGEASHDKELIHDVKEIGKIVPKFSTLTVPPQMYDQYDFVLQGYLVRYCNISIDPNKKYKYYLIEKDIKADIPSIYKKVNTLMTKYDLYKQ